MALPEFSAIVDSSQAPVKSESGGRAQSDGKASGQPSWNAASATGCRGRSASGTATVVRRYWASQLNETLDNWRKEIATMRFVPLDARQAGTSPTAESVARRQQAKRPADKNVERGLVALTGALRFSADRFSWV